MENLSQAENMNYNASSVNKRKILFANIPGHGHFNPLTGLAVYLKEQGYDVRWYAGSLHHKKLAQLHIPYYPFKKTKDIDPARFEEIFPERERYKGEVAKLNFDIQNVFVLRATEQYEDIKAIKNDFPFDVMICDISFTGFPLVKEKLGVPVLTVGIFPIMSNSRDLPPYGLAMTPSYSFMGRLKQNLLRFLADKVLFKKSHQLYKNILKEYGIEAHGNIFDIAYNKSTLVLQNGTPGFDYSCSDLPNNIRFMGPLFPASIKTYQPQELAFKDKLKNYKKVILVTQGTVETDVDKIITPTLEAFKDSDYLVVATTGGSRTSELKERFPQENLVIDDFIAFDDIMPHCDVYVTNGGYGGVMYGIKNRLPLVVGGIHEGKNEICARIGYLELGINLKTETPKASEIKKAVETILADNTYKFNVIKLSEEFKQYSPGVLCEKYINQVI